MNETDEGLSRLTAVGSSVVPLRPLRKPLRPLRLISCFLERQAGEELAVVPSL